MWRPDPCLEKYWQIFVYFKYHNSQCNDHKINLYFLKNCLLNFHCFIHSALMRFFKILLKPALVSCDSPGVTHYGIPCTPILYYTMVHAIHHLRSGYQNVSSSRLFWIHNLFCGFFLHINKHKHKQRWRLSTLEREGGLGDMNGLLSGEETSEAHRQTQLSVRRSRLHWNCKLQ